MKKNLKVFLYKILVLMAGGGIWTTWFKVHTILSGTWWQLGYYLLMLFIIGEILQMIPMPDGGFPEIIDTSIAYTASFIICLFWFIVIPASSIAIAIVEIKYPSQEVNNRR